MPTRIIRSAMLLALLFRTAAADAQTYDWNSAASGNYNTAGLWSGGVVPGSGQDAVINATGANYTVTLSSSLSVQDLLLNSANATFSQTAGTYTVAGNLTLQAGTYSLSGGTISGATLINGGGSGTMVFSGNSTLNNVQITSAGILNLSTANATLNFTGGSNFAVASAYTTGNNFTLAVNQTQPITNVALTLTNGNVVGAGTALTLGSSGGGTGSIDILGTGNAPDVYSNSGTIANYGTIENTGSGNFTVDASGGFTNYGILRNTSPATGTLTAGYSTRPFTNAAGGVIDIQSGTGVLTGAWTNAGTVKLASGATLYLQGTFANTDIGTISRGGTVAGTAGTVYLNGGGTLTQNSDLDLSLTTGTAVMNAFTIMGAGYNLKSSGSAKLTVSTGTNTFNNVQVAAGALDLSTSGGSLTLTGGSNFAVASAYTTGNNFTLAVNQTQPITNVALTLTNGNVVGAGTALTLGSSGGGTGSIDILGTGNAPDVYSNSGTIANYGTIENTGSGNFTVDASGGFTNYGILRNTSPATGTLTAGYSTRPFTNAAGGVIDIQSGTGVLTGAWTNAGTVKLASGATLYLQGTFANTDIGTISRGGTVAGTAGTVYLNGGGTLTQNSDLDLSLTTGTAIMNNFTITGAGYNLKSSGSAKLTVSTGTNTFNNVQVAAGALDLSTSGGSLTLTGGSNFAVASAYTTGNNFTLAVNQTQPITNVALTLTNGNVVGAGTALTLGSSGGGTGSIDILGTGNAPDVYSNSGTIANYGTIENTGSGNFTVDASGGFTNYGILRNTSPATGTLTAGYSTRPFTNAAGGVIDIQSGTGVLTGAWTNAGTVKLASGATLYLQGTFANTDIGTISRGGTVAGTAGTVYLNGGGTLTQNSDLDLSLTTGTAIMNNFTITGAGYNLKSTGSAKLTVGSGTNTFNNVQVAAGALDLSTASGSLTLTGGTNFAAGSVYTTGTGFGFQVNQAQAIDNVALTLGDSTQIYANGSNPLNFGTASDIKLTGGASAVIETTGTQAIALNGTVESSSTGTLKVYTPGGAISIAGTVSNGSSGGITIGYLTTAQTVTVASGGTLQALGGTLALASGVTLTNYNAATNTLSVGTYRAVGNATMNLGSIAVATIAANTDVEIGGTATFAALNGLQVNNGTFSISGGKSFTVANSANSFSNGGTLNVSGTGTFTIGNAITLTNYASNTLTGGTWNISDTAALSLGSASIATLASGTSVTLTTNASVPALNALATINSGAALQLLNGQNLSVAGSLANAGTLVLGGGTLTVPGTFANTGSLTGSGTITSPANFNTGGSVAVSGTITLGSTLAVNAATTLSSGTLNVSGTTTLNNSFTVAAGATYGGGGTAVVPGGQTLTVNGTVDAAKPVSLTGTLGGYGAVNGTVTANAGALIQGIGGTLSLAALTVAGNASIAGSVAASGTTSITGASLTVGGESSLGGSGSITVGSGGSLVVPTISSAVSQTVTVQSGGRTNGTGSLGSLVIQSGGLLKPGNSPGTISIQSGVSDAGVVEIDIPTGTPGATTTPGTSNGTVMVQSGNSTVRTGAIIQVKTDSVGAPSFAPGAFWGTAESWLIWSTQNGQFVDSNGTPTTSPGFGYAMVDSNENPVPNYSNYGAFSTVVLNSTTAASSITLDWTPVPEPMAVLGLASLALGGAVGLSRKGGCVCRNSLTGFNELQSRLSRSRPAKERCIEDSTLHADLG